MMLSPVGRLTTSGAQARPFRAGGSHHTQADEKHGLLAALTALGDRVTHLNRTEGIPARRANSLAKDRLDALTRAVAE